MECRSLCSDIFASFALYMNKTILWENRKLSKLMNNATINPASRPLTPKRLPIQIKIALNMPKSTIVFIQFEIIWQYKMYKFLKLLNFLWKKFRCVLVLYSAGST